MISENIHIYLSHSTFKTHSFPETHGSCIRSKAWLCQSRKDSDFSCKKNVNTNRGNKFQPSSKNTGLVVNKKSVLHKRILKFIKVVVFQMFCKAYKTSFILLKL